MSEGFYKDVIKALKAHGYERIKGGKGSHEKWNNTKQTLLVPKNCKSRHTANGIMNDAGLGKPF